MKTRSVKRWVIVGNCGLYVGQAMRRGDMIAEHVLDVHGAGSGFFTFNRLGEAQREAWKKCQRRGDRAVLATIIIPKVSP